MPLPEWTKDEKEVKLRAGAAESQFAQGEKCDAEDIIAIALMHSEKFEINEDTWEVKLKEA